MKKRKREVWYLYILKCRDGTLYTGITKDLERRLRMHNDGKGARFTRARRPVALLFQESFQNRTQALVRECEIKELTRKKKEALLATAHIRVRIPEPIIGD